LFVKIYMYIYLFDYTYIFYEEFIDNFSIYVLIMCCLYVTVSTSIWNCISIGSMENKANSLTN